MKKKTGDQLMMESLIMWQSQLSGRLAVAEKHIEDLRKLEAHVENNAGILQKHHEILFHKTPSVIESIKASVRRMFGK